MSRVTVLDESECLRLLRTRVVGRLGFVTPEAIPMILPVNYAVVDRTIQILTTEHGPLRHWTTSAAVVAFEVDDLDAERWSGWSVLAHGRCEVVSEPEASHLLQRLPRPRPWADGDRRTLLRLRWTQLGGRRLGGAATTRR